MSAAARERGYREAFYNIALSLLDPQMDAGSCHGCVNIGHDALHWLRKEFPNELDFLELVHEPWGSHGDNIIPDDKYREDDRYRIKKES